MQRDEGKRDEECVHISKVGPARSQKESLSPTLTIRTTQYLQGYTKVTQWLSSKT
jgi:hypothetical protein